MKEKDYYNFLFEDEDTGERFFVALCETDYQSKKEALREAKAMSLTIAKHPHYYGCYTDLEANMIGYDTY